MFAAPHSHWSSPLGILLVSTIGVALGLVVGILLLFIVVLVLKRRADLCVGSNSPVYDPAVHTNSTDYSNRVHHPDYGSTTVPPQATPKQHRHHENGLPASFEDKMELVALNISTPYSTRWGQGPPAYTPNSTSATVLAPDCLKRRPSIVCQLQMPAKDGCVGRLATVDHTHQHQQPDAAAIADVAMVASNWSPQKLTECTYEFGTRHHHIYETPEMTSSTTWPVTIDEFMMTSAGMEVL